MTERKTHFNEWKSQHLRDLVLEHFAQNEQQTKNGLSMQKMSKTHAALSNCLDVPHR